MISKGAYAVVKTCDDISTVKKCFKKDFVLVPSFIKEIYILNLLKASDYIVNYVSHSYMNGTITLEKLDMDLYTYLYLTGHIFSENDMTTMLFDISVGIYHLNKFDIIHGDIKPENILIKVDDRSIPMYVLCDFGLSQKFDIDSIYTKQSIGYQSPEVLINFHVKDKIDIYSLALIIFNYSVKCDITYQSDSSLDHIYRYCNLNKYYSEMCLNDLLYYIDTSTNHISNSCDNYDNCDNYDSCEDSEYSEIYHNTNSIIYNGKYSNFYENEEITESIMMRLNNDICAENILSEIGYSDDFCELLQNMLMFIPNERFTIESVLSSNLFNDKEIPEINMPNPHNIIYIPNINIDMRDKQILEMLSIIHNLDNINPYCISYIIINSIYLFDKYLTLNTIETKYLYNISISCVIISCELILGRFDGIIEDIKIKKYIESIVSSLLPNLYFSSKIYHNLSREQLKIYIKNICSLNYYSMNSQTILENNDIVISEEISNLLYFLDLYDI